MEAGDGSESLPGPEHAFNGLRDTVVDLNCTVELTDMPALDLLHDGISIHNDTFGGSSIEAGAHSHGDMDAGFGGSSIEVGAHSHGDMDAVKLGAFDFVGADQIWDAGLMSNHGSTVPPAPFAQATATLAASPKRAPTRRRARKVQQKPPPPSEVIKAAQVKLEAPDSTTACVCCLAQALGLESLAC